VIGALIANTVYGPGSGGRGRVQENKLIKEKVMINKIMGCMAAIVLVVSMFALAPAAQAGSVIAVNFALDNPPVGWETGDPFVYLEFSKENEIVNFTVMFNYTDAGWDNIAPVGVYFKNIRLSENFSEYLDFNEDNFQKLYVPAIAKNLTFANSHTWAEFVGFVEDSKSDVYIQADIYDGYESLIREDATFSFNRFVECTENCPEPSDVPEPGSILLLGSGIAGLGLVARRKLGKK